MTATPALGLLAPGDSLARVRLLRRSQPFLGQREGPQAPPGTDSLDQFQSMIWKISQSYCAAVRLYSFRSCLVVYVPIIWPSKEILVLPTEGNMGADKGLYTKGLRTVNARMIWGSLEARPSRTGEQPWFLPYPGWASVSQEI